MGNKKSKVSEHGLKYMPLKTGENQIRLIKFEQRRPEEPERLNLSLHTVSLDEKPTYNCLSYVWGAPDFKWPVYVNGFLVHITPTLGQALNQLEHENLEALWADSICIDQRDTAEREAQVKLMSRIYNARPTLLGWAWAMTSCVRVFRSLTVFYLDHVLELYQVGPDEIVPEIVNLMAGLKDAIKLEDEHDTRDAFVIDAEYGLLTRVNIALVLGAMHLRADVGLQIRRELPLVPTTDYEEFVTSWERLMSRPFWRRLWIVQELIQPDVVILRCGSTSARLEYLHAFRNFVHKTNFSRFAHFPGIEDHFAKFVRLYACLKNPANSLDVIASMRESRFLDTEFVKTWDITSMEPLDTIHGMLRRCWQLESTVQLDKIYGLMNISRDVEELQELVDYKKSLGRLGMEVMRMTLIRHGLKRLQEGLLFYYPTKTDGPSDQVEYTAVHPYWPSWMNIAEALTPYPGAQGPYFLLHHGRSEVGVKQFQASGTYSLHVSASDFRSSNPDFPFNDILRVRCRIIGEIKRVCHLSLQAWSRDAEDETAKLTMSQLVGTQLAKASDTLREFESFFDQEDDLESMLHGKPLWWLFCLQRDVSSSDSVLTLSWLKDMEDLENQFLALKNKTPHPADCINQRSVLMRWIQVYSPLTIDTGYVGLGPRQSTGGDKVVIFPDVDVPYVLRPYKDGFKILGQAYILGIMSGEFLETDRPESFVNLM